MTRTSNRILAGTWSALAVGAFWMGCGVGPEPGSESSDTVAFSLPGHGPGNPGRPSPRYGKREGFSFGGHGVPGRHGYRGHGGPGKVCGGTGGGKGQGTGGASGKAASAVPVARGASAAVRPVGSAGPRAAPAGRRR